MAQKSVEMVLERDPGDHTDLEAAKPNIALKTMLLHGT